MCNICEQRRHQPIRIKDLPFQNKTHSFSSTGSVPNQLSCTSYLCHSKNPMSNILCDICIWNSKSQQDMIECQVDSHSQSESLISYTKQWVCSVCIYSNQESSRLCNICQLGFKPRPASELYQFGVIQATREGNIFYVHS